LVVVEATVYYFEGTAAQLLVKLFREYAVETAFRRHFNHFTAYLGERKRGYHF
jgi:hypothetical protein